MTTAVFRVVEGVVVVISGDVVKGAAARGRHGEQPPRALPVGAGGAAGHGALHAHQARAHQPRGSWTHLPWHRLQ